jgi:hypothetical protein
MPATTKRLRPQLSPPKKGSKGEHKALGGLREQMRGEPDCTGPNVGRPAVPSCPCKKKRRTLPAQKTTLLLRSQTKRRPQTQVPYFPQAHMHTHTHTQLCSMHVRQVLAQVHSRTLCVIQTKAEGTTTTPSTDTPAKRWNGGGWGATRGSQRRIYKTQKHGREQDVCSTPFLSTRSPAS